MSPSLRFLHRATLLGLPFLSLVLAFEAWTAWDRSVYAQKKAALERIAPRLETLVLGSSQSYYGILPHRFPRPAFNLAFPAQTLRYDSALLDRYLDRLPQLRTVLLPISYFTLEHELEFGSEARRSCHYRYHFGIPNPSHHHRDEARNFFNLLLSGRQQVAGLLREQARSLLGRAGQKSEGVDLLDDLGGLAHTDDPHPSPQDLERDADWVVRLHEDGMRPAALPANVELLQSLHARLRSRGIRLILFTPPVTLAYHNRLNPTRLQAILATTRNLAQALQIDYHDFSQDPRFTNADFRDSNHLNAAGRDRFSRLLADLL